VYLFPCSVELELLELGICFEGVCLAAMKEGGIGEFR
jgi:hypothetical protein